MLDYVLADGQRFFFNISANMYLDLMRPKGITDEITKQAYLLGWAQELVSFLYFYDNSHSH